MQKDFGFQHDRFIINACLVTAIRFIILIYITSIDFKYNSLVLHLLGSTNNFIEIEPLDQVCETIYYSHVLYFLNFLTTNSLMNLATTFCS